MSLFSKKVKKIPSFAPPVRFARVTQDLICNYIYFFMIKPPLLDQQLLGIALLIKLAFLNYQLTL